jgi:2-polyprenyl-6-hydroxyphenyl methylase/3-demethylubiquinone-9 3-methyltransferase
MTQEAPRQEHGQQFIDYYERASASERATVRSERVRDCALLLARDAVHPQSVLKVADIGCGAGTQSLIWAAGGHRVAAVDVSEALIAIGRRRAEEKGLRVEFSVGSAQSLPFAAEQFDVVLMPELLEHVPDWENCLGEATRVLRPGGVLYVSTTNRLCPKQQEFELPLYSWYPRPIKRWCEGKALTTHPEWANHTRFPAVNWFTYFELRDWLSMRSVQTLDRFDVMRQQHRRLLEGAVATMICRLPPLRWLAHVASEGTVIWGIKRRGPNR